jgi:enoyl-CoA hydratase
VIASDVADRVGVITIDRPERRNALDIEHCQALQAAIGQVVREGARAVLLTGAGTSFCAGADFAEVYDQAFRDALYSALAVVRAAPVPVIAAVNGPAIGAGTQLAVACDLCVASNDAVFGVPTARIGLAVDVWTIRRLAAIAGAGVASAIVLGCKRLDATEALQCGLAQRIGDSEDARAWANEIAGLAPLTLDYSKRVLQETATGVPDDGLLAAFERCWESEDLKEGELARVEGRAPLFRGH